MYAFCHPIGCENLANQYYSGLSVTMDQARGVQLYQRSCDLGAATGCVDVGIIYRDGMGGVRSKNPAYAAQLFQRACDLVERVLQCADADEVIGCTRFNLFRSWSLLNGFDAIEGVSGLTIVRIRRYSIRCDSATNGVRVTVRGDCQRRAAPAIDTRSKGMFLRRSFLRSTGRVASIGDPDPADCSATTAAQRDQPFIVSAERWYRTRARICAGRMVPLEAPSAVDANVGRNPVDWN
jgi:hypothetical protein